MFGLELIRPIDLMLDRCWLTVTTLAQHQPNIGSMHRVCWNMTLRMNALSFHVDLMLGRRCTSWADILDEHLAFSGYSTVNVIGCYCFPAHKWHYPNAGLMLAHRLWHWSSIRPSLFLRVLLSAATHSCLLGISAVLTLYTRRAGQGRF